ncbi:PREDICTED: cholinesterase 1-like [Papilio polytes]|uniref:cholinesterase 1-like n=1 Tax=Papilio polytes TaxID=76194 RepID=UPI00067650E8|nr:PREDICTED: cholinesterase 1-like [Papilio polytes]
MNQHKLFFIIRRIRSDHSVAYKYFRKFFNMVRVQISDGILEGEVTNNEYGGKIFSFKGIPYAQPPLGDLRFKAPLPPKSWNGVRDAKKIKDQCYQYDRIFGKTNSGSEDCLYINVFSPNITPAKPLPVMVWIHGGGFTNGSGSDEIYGPDYLIRNDVILVTFNYRLEVLGFLCLDTEDVPGNAGMKDQVAALRWVQKNISKFGGDPNNVTIFGESAGGVSVSFHLLSPMSKGLFQKAIPQSGTAIAHWPTGFMIKDRSLQLARDLGCTSKDEREVYNFLKSQPVEALVNQHTTVTYAEAYKEAFLVPYSITAEKQFGNNERFMVAEPIEVLRNYGIHEGVDIMEGYTEDEGVACLGFGLNVHKMFFEANKYPEFFVPRSISIHCPLIDQMEVGKMIKSHYLKDEDVSMDNVYTLQKYFGTECFKYPSILFQKICAKRGKNKIFLYRFTCKSELNVFKHLLGAADIVGDRTVACHADELPYIFPIKFFTANNPNIDISRVFNLINQVTKLWTNFAKYGNPTPDESLGVIWKPYSLEGQDFLDIGTNLVADTASDRDEMEFWERIFKKYCPKFAP